MIMSLNPFEFFKGDEPNSEKRLVVTPGNVTQWKIEDLRPNVVYFIRLAAVNAVGSSLPTRPPLRFRTNQESPEGAVTQLAAESNSSQSILVEWKVANSRCVK